MEYTLVLLN